MAGSFEKTMSDTTSEMNPRIRTVAIMYLIIAFSIPWLRAVFFTGEYHRLTLDLQGDIFLLIVPIPGRAERGDLGS